MLISALWRSQKLYGASHGSSPRCLRWESFCAAKSRREKPKMLRIEAWPIYSSFVQQKRRGKNIGHLSFWGKWSGIILNLNMIRWCRLMQSSDSSENSCLILELDLTWLAPFLAFRKDMYHRKWCYKLLRRLESGWWSTGGIHAAAVQRIKTRASTSPAQPNEIASPPPLWKDQWISKASCHFVSIEFKNCQPMMHFNYMFIYRSKVKESFPLCVRWVEGALQTWCE